MLKLIKFSLDCGRMGSLESVEVIDEEDLKLYDLYVSEGFSMYLSEYLGKHSEIELSLDGKNDFTILSEDQERIEWLVSIVGDTHIAGNIHLFGKMYDTFYDYGPDWGYDPDTMEKLPEDETLSEDEA